MAELQPNFKFTGSLGDFTAYHNMRTGKITIQQKGRPVKTKTGSDPKSVQNLLRQEFKGMSKLARSIRHSMSMIQQLPDYRMSGPLTGHMAQLKELDGVNRLGERTIALSQKRSWLEGWQISHEFIFEQVMRNPVLLDMDRVTLSCNIHIPALIPGGNFNAPGVQPYYRWIASLGIVHDYYFDGKNDYRTAEGFEMIMPAVHAGEWRVRDQAADAFTINLQLPPTYQPLPDAASLICTIAVNGGRMKAGGLITSAKYGSAGKVIKVG